jgi:hypothetical protein
MTKLKEKLIEQINKTTCRLVFKNNDINMCAIKNITKNSPVMSFTQNIFNVIKVVKVAIKKLDKLDNNIKDFINSIFEDFDGYYYIPEYGINSMMILYYTKSNSKKFNVIFDENQFMTIKSIKLNDTIVLNSKEYQKYFKISSTTTENQIIKHLMNDVYCKLEKSKISGVGVTLLKNINSNINPFNHVANKCYDYKGLLVNKKEISKYVSNENIKKIITDFIFADENDNYYIPYNGLMLIDITFFLNHSTKPNLDVVLNKCEYFEFVTPKKISKYVELCIDYNEYAN